MLCCFRPAVSEEGPAAGQQQQQQQQATAVNPQHSLSFSSVASAGGGLFRRDSSSGQQQPQQQQQAAEGAAQPAAGLQPHHANAQLEQAGVGQSGSDAPPGGGDGVLALVALLQELLALSTSSPKQPLSKAMALLVQRLPVDWAALHVIGSAGRLALQVRVARARQCHASASSSVTQRRTLCLPSLTHSLMYPLIHSPGQVGGALSPAAQRLRGASGSNAATGTTPVRQRLSLNQGQPGGNSTGGAVGSSAGTGVVLEVGAGGLALLAGSSSSLEAVSTSRAALAMYAGADGDADGLPHDWARLYADRDLRVRQCGW
jgi:hypothetical protein